ncbi:DUF6957 family protein [Pseudoalteromonas spongiae]|uniref:DUF6957 family protein n=1 Tax=Pseudoalteromonas spongiae TaxID=298657 RepID=UPI00110B36D9|nr:hypothetical protein [Pseudoalteromonas spongiae]TMO84434.1 hypothetical protein CWC15_10830 [Pseudoalteromonas spongiae]
MNTLPVITPVLQTTVPDTLRPYISPRGVVLPEKSAEFPTQIRQVSLKRWLIIDVLLTSKEHMTFESHGYLPRVVFSEDIVEHTEPRGFEWVLSSWQSVEHPELNPFVTQNSVYLLNGPGNHVTMGWRYFARLLKLRPD